MKYVGFSLMVLMGIICCAIADFEANTGIKTADSSGAEGWSTAGNIITLTALIVFVIHALRDVFKDCDD